jgi:beta-lactamase superfamily II metal-dependent hydrolase
MRHFFVCALAVAVLLLTGMAAAETPNRVTILYDSFGKNPSLTMDWGFAALIEYGGKRILFDTGNNAKIFEHNVKAVGVDLGNLDFVVMSHRHGDHNQVQALANDLTRGALSTKLSRVLSDAGAKEKDVAFTVYQFLESF